MSIKLNFKNVFDTWKWKNYIPFWRSEESSLIDYMNELKLPFREYNSIFESHGFEFYEIIKKLTLDRMLDPEFESMTSNEKAMLGATIFLELMKQLRYEILEMDDKG